MTKNINKKMRYCKSCNKPYQTIVVCRCGHVGCKSCIVDGVCVDCVVGNTQQINQREYFSEKIKNEI